LLFCTSTLTAQSLQECENLFVSNNLFLISERLNIDIKETEIIQAGIWELPQFSAELNMVNPNQNRYFDIGKAGQKSMQLDQLIYMGNKKKYQLDFAKSNKDIAIIAFNDILRNLSFKLKSDYCSLFYTNIKLSNYWIQIQNLDTLIMRFKVQVDKKNIPEKDLFRLQSLRFNIYDSYRQLNESKNELQASLNLICGVDTNIQPSAFNFDDFLSRNNQVNLQLDSLFNLAITHRPDYLSIIKSIESQNFYIKWQKALAVPDIRIGAAYDQRGGAFQDQIGLTLSAPLYLWNPNKGEIQKADYQKRQMEVDLKIAEQSIKGEILTSYNNYLLSRENVKLRGSFDIEKFNEVYNAYVTNFRKGNVTILEFIDFVESYNFSISQYKDIELKYIISAYTLNKCLGYNLLK